MKPDSESQVRSAAVGLGFFFWRSRRQGVRRSESTALKRTFGASQTAWTVLAAPFDEPEGMARKTFDSPLRSGEVTKKVRMEPLVTSSGRCVPAVAVYGPTSACALAFAASAHPCAWPGAR